MLDLNTVIFFRNENIRLIEIGIEEVSIPGTLFSINGGREKMEIGSLKGAFKVRGLKGEYALGEKRVEEAFYPLEHEEYYHLDSSRGNFWAK